MNDQELAHCLAEPDREEHFNDLSPNLSSTDLEQLAQQVATERILIATLQPQTRVDTIMKRLTDGDGLLQLVEERERQLKRRRWPLFIATAACLLCAIFWYTTIETNRYPILVHGEKLSSAHQLGNILTDTESLEIEDGGFSTLRYEDGSLIHLYGPARCTAQPHTLNLMHGTVEAQVHTRIEKPFSIRTPHCTTTVLGTRFSVTSNTEHSLVQVEHGTVRCDATNGQSALLIAGQAALTEKETLTHLGHLATTQPLALGRQRLHAHLTQAHEQKLWAGKPNQQGMQGIKLAGTNGKFYSVSQHSTQKICTVQSSDSLLVTLRVPEPTHNDTQLFQLRLHLLVDNKKITLTANAYMKPNGLWTTIHMPLRLMHATNNDWDTAICTYINIKTPIHNKNFTVSDIQILSAP